MPEQTLLDLMLLYLLDDLDASDRQAIDRRLAENEPAAVAALAEARELLGAVPSGLDPIKPDPSSLEKLMARVRAEEAAVPESSTPIAATHGPISIWPKLAIAASFVLGVGLAAVVVWSLMQPSPAQIAQGPDSADWDDLQTIVRKQQSQLTEQRDRMAAMQSELAAVQGTEQAEQLQQLIQQQRLAIAHQQQRISELQESVSLLAGPGVKQAELAGAAEIPNAQGRLMWDPVTGQMRLLTRGLAELQEGETYQLWFVTEEGKTVSLGVFSVGETTETTAAYVATVPGVPSNVNVAAISIESKGGSTTDQGPQGPIIMQGQPKTE